MRIQNIRVYENFLPKSLRRFFKFQYLILLVFVILSLSTFFFYKASIKNYKLSNYILYARGVISNNINIIPNYFFGVYSQPEIIFIDMNSLNIQKLSYLRNQALNNKDGVIMEEFKSETVKGKLTYKGKSHKADLSLTGQNMDHINNSYKWSFRVNLKGEGRIDGIKKFTLLVPHTRGSDQLSEFIGHKLMKHVGLISLRYDYKKVILNGKDYGIYAFEEHLDKRTLESNGLRDGIIIKATPGSFKVFKEEKIRSNKLFLSQLNYLQKKWIMFLKGEIPSKSIFNIEKLAKYYAISDIINGQHTHYLGNEIFHFNPMTLLLEPIGREWDAPYVDDNDFKIFLNNINAIASDVNSKEFQNLVFEDIEFIELYLEYLNRYSEYDFIENFMKENIGEILDSKYKLYSQYPYLDANENILYEQIDKIKYELSNVEFDYMKSYEPEEIIINSSNWVITNNFVVNKNQKLIVNEGVNIDMINNAGIISYGEIILQGSEEKPIVINSSDNTGTGIKVFFAKNRSRIENTIFSGIETSKKTIRSLTSPVFFYESDVDIVDSLFKNNASEDMLNIFRSDFSIKGSTFINSFSDAFDSDFSTGEIVDTEFIDLGNDAIDLSGSYVSLSNIVITNALDKAISLGENSESYGKNIVIKNSNLGISSKDLSFFSYSDVYISNAEVAYSIYQKKEEFGPSSGEVIVGSLDKNKVDFIIEENSNLKINNELLNGNYKNVKGLMYGNVFGTATSRDWSFLELDERILYLISDMDTIFRLIRYNFEIFYTK